MLPEFYYLWAKDVVLWEMEQDGVLHRVRRIAMGAVCSSATHRATGAGLVEAAGAEDGFRAAATVFERLAVAPDPWSAGTAQPDHWREAARRARIKARLGSSPPSARVA